MTTPEPNTPLTPPEQPNSQDSDAAKAILAESQYNAEKKNAVPMWLLWFFTGGIGGHRYYLGHIPYAIGMTLTLGGLGFWSLIDAFLLPGALRRANGDIRAEIFERHGFQVERHQ